MRGLIRRCVAVAAITGACIGGSACGSSSNHSSANTGGGSATPSTTASGPLTKAAVLSLAQAERPETQPYALAIRSHDLTLIGLATPTQVAVVRKFVASLSALRAQSPAAAGAQQRFVASLKHVAAVEEQMGKAASANDAAAYNALLRTYKMAQEQGMAATTQLLAALK